MGGRIYSIDELVGSLPDPPVIQAAQRPAYSGAERPGDEFNRLHTATEVLEWLGFTYAHKDHQGQHWTRPGKSTREGASATIYDDPDGQHITVWSDTCVQMWPHLELRRPYDPYGLWVATCFDGDHTAAAKKLAEEGYGEPIVVGPNLIDELEAYLLQNAPASLTTPTRLTGAEEPTGWEPIDLVEAMRAGPPPPPDIFPRTDGVNILYRRKIHYFYGPPESLKSWAAQVITAWTAKAAGHVIYLDFENDQFSFAERMVALGVTEAQIGAITYLNPDKAFTDRARNLLRSVLEQGADLVVVDGVSNVMGLLGKSPLNHDDVVEFEMNFLRPLTISGGAVVAIDHTAKNTEAGNGNPSLFGGQHKKAAVTGASFYFRLVEPFGRGMSGIAKMELDKDKPGYLRQHVEFDGIAELHMHSKPDGSIVVELLPPGVPPDFRPTGIMEQLSRYVELSPGVTTEEAVHKGTTSEKVPLVRSALNRLLTEAYLAKDLGSGLLRSVRPYRRDDDPLDDKKRYDPLYEPPEPVDPDDPYEKRKAKRMGFGLEEDAEVEEKEPAGVAEKPVGTVDFFGSRAEQPVDTWDDLLDLGVVD